ncbi:hypothetical protein VTL71DRAFT_573 [Oculimacula yallundae]|uniref:DUF202 domain-containing protein n=1 Tax=Oculimacula yallundae TaxID=86028 RepID=A0ABR4D0K1_9HELO
MSRLLKYLASPPIANTGSVARDHLANERTFLSWTRTGLGFIALGIALAKLDALEALSLTKNPSLPLSSQNSSVDDLRIPSAALVGSGTGCLSYGTIRYFRSLKLLQRGLFRPNVAGVGLVALTSGAVAGGGVYLLVKEEMRR